MSSNVNKSVNFEWMFLELIKMRDECMVRIGGQSKQYGAELREMINLKRFYFTMISWWDHGCRNRWIYDGIRSSASWKTN